MMGDTGLEAIREPLLAWYGENKRSLPWRDQGNAYYTWVSEIMLQQTRVETVIPYFSRFVLELPDIPALASCPEEKLLKLWEGLGYYSRVRNLHKTSRILMEKYGGELPSSYEELTTLPGIGTYTGSAIASIAFSLPVPAVDGNVLRIISRITGDREDVDRPRVKKRIREELSSLIPPDRPGDFNQGLMELGQVICLPGENARCSRCPLSLLCSGYRDGNYARLPVKTPKAARKIEERTVLLIREGEKTAIQKRPSRGLLAGLYEFPGFSGYLTPEEALEKVREMGLCPLYIERLEDSRHIFTHLEWRMRAYLIRVSSLEEPKGDLIFARKEQLEREYALPSAFAQYTRILKGEEKVK